MSLQHVTTDHYAAGHGTSSEIFPPVELNGRNVSLEISSSAPPTPEMTGLPPTDSMPEDGLRVAMSLIDSDTTVTLRDVTFLVRAERGDAFLFEREFAADNGFLVFNFVSDDNNKITIEEDAPGESREIDIIGQLLGVESRMIHVNGPELADGGLYKFDISILTAGDYADRLATPLQYDSGISIPQITTYEIDDPNFGEQYIRTVTYYDEIYNFEYDSEMKEIRYSMPFEWSEENIEQSYVVHNELIIPDGYGDLLISGFDMSVNGMDISDGSVNIDDFFVGERIIHFIISQDELYGMFENQTAYQKDGGGEQMDFVIRPDLDYTRIGKVTENGQFRIFVSWEPEDLRSGEDARIMFEVTDIFLRNLPVAAEYEISVTKDDRTVFEQTGTSASDRNAPTTTAEFKIPEDVSGIVHLNFESLDGNDRARTSIPIVVDRVVGSAIVMQEDDTGGGSHDNKDGGGTDNTNGSGSSGGGGGGCLIATATYGSELAPQIQQLRELRDNTILETESGTAFMSGFNQIYYTFSPAIADLERENPALRETVKVMLTPMISSLSLLNHADIDTEAELLVYGTVVIVLNIGMYVGIPVGTAVFVGARLRQNRT